MGNAKNIKVLGPLDIFEGRWSFADDARWDEKHDPDMTEDRIRPPSHVNTLAFHTTGYGVKLKKLDKLGDDALADEKWMRFQADNLEFKPHGTIGRLGGLCQFSPGKYRQHHIGGGGSVRKGALAPGSVRQLSDQSKWLRPSTAWWLEVYPHLDSPTQLPCWQPLESKDGKKLVYSPNQRTIALDLLAPKPGQPYTSAQLRKLAIAAAAITVGLGLVCDYEHVLDHSRVSPPDRSNRNGAWDFDERFNWPHWWTMLAEERAKLGHDTAPYGTVLTKRVEVRVEDKGASTAATARREKDLARVQRLLVELGEDLGDWPPARPDYPLGCDGDWGRLSKRALDSFRQRARYKEASSSPVRRDVMELERAWLKRHGGESVPW